jgi:hypothetical protein
MSAGSVTVRLNLSSAGYSAEMAKAEAQMRRLQAVTGEMGLHTVSQMQAASASIRVLEGGISNNIRAAERFISMLPGVGAALQAAFPVVGAIALIGVFVRVGEEVVKFIQKLNAIPENPFAGMIASSKLSNDALAITNDRLQLEIEKLEKKPQNRLALALDEMRDASDKLFDSLEKSNAAFDQAMGKGGVGTLQGHWQNLTPTDQADADIKKARAGVQAVNADHATTIQDALNSGDPENIRQAREAWMKDLQDAYAKQDAALRAGLDKAQAAAADFHGSYSTGSDPRAVAGRYSSALQISAQDQQRIGGQYGNSLLTGQRDTDQDANDQSELAKAAAKKELQTMEDALEQRRAQYGVSIVQERSYWQQREAAFTAGSDAYRTVVNKVAGLEIQMQRQQAESIKAARGEQSSDARDSLHVLESASAAMAAVMKREGEDVLQTGERWKAYNDAVTKAGEIQAANAAAFDKTRIALELASGQLSKLYAAEQMAAVHAREFTSDLETLQKQRKQIEGDGDLTDVQRVTALKQNSNAQVALQGQNQAQQLGDQSAIADQQLGPATRKALGTMVQEWGNMTQGIVQTMTKAMDSFNDDLVKAMTGHGSKADFGKTLSAAGEGLLKTSLQSAEAKIMGAFGLGKPDGTANNPIYTRDASTAGLGGAKIPFVRPFIGGQQDQNGQGGQNGQNGQGGGSIWSKLYHSFFGGKSDQGGGGSDGGGGGGIVPQLLQRNAGGGGGDGGGGDAGDGLGDIGIFGGGGNFMANHPMIVGDKGPELLVPGNSGRIIPNHQLGGGRGGDTHIHVDARGSNDPAAIHAAVMRAAPHIVAASLQSHHQSAKRSPHGR